jgi:hypothetical protein
VGKTIVVEQHDLAGEGDNIRQDWVWRRSPVSALFD